jgi:hypothetical protein
MGAAAAYVGDLGPAIAKEVYLGPARVVAMLGAAPLVELPDGARVRGEMALAFPYAPAEGDTLLVIGKGGAHYVIGVLKAGGAVSLRFEGDVELSAVGGSLTLAADQQVTIRAPRAEVTTGKLQVLADSVIEKVGSLYQRVRGALQVHSGQRIELVDGDTHTRAERMSVTTRGVVAINGKEVHLA